MSGQDDALPSTETQPQQPALPEEPIDFEQALREEMAEVLGGPHWTGQNGTPRPLSELFKELHEKQDKDRPSALCLSGGGIRSATFSLGVLQWLARQGQLKDFHYLSTVSGGGYIGSWLINALWRARTDAESAHPEAAQAGQNAVDDWLQRLGHSAGSIGASQAAGATSYGAAATDPVAPLRAYSNFLSPTGGLSTDAFSLVAIFLRNLLLNALVWLPLLAAAVALPRGYIAALTGGPALNPVATWDWWPLWLVLVGIIFGLAYIVADLPAPGDRPAVHSPTPPTDRFDPACFVPITAAAILLSLLGAWTEPLHKLDWWWFAVGGALAHLLGVALGVPWRLYIRKLPMRPAKISGMVMVATVGAAGGLLASLVLSQLGQGAAITQASAAQRLLYASFAVPAMTGAFWLAMALHAGLTGRFTTEEDREWWARATAAWLKFSLQWVAAFALVVWGPLLILDHAADAGFTAAQLGIGGGVLGMLTSLMAYWSKHGTQIQSKARSIIAVAGLRLLDVMAALAIVIIVLALSLAWNAALDRCHGWGVARVLCTNELQAETEFLREQARQRAATVAPTAAADAALVRIIAPVTDPVSAEVAMLGDSAGAQVYAHVLIRGSGAALTAAFGVLLLISIILALLMGANQFSLHGMYGNRLVRAYLGSGRSVRHPHWFTGFDREDNPPLACLSAPLTIDGRPRLYPLINIALNLVRPSRKHLDWQQRKAASFTATPKHCGSAHLGFRPTALYSGGMSLGRAMTISGAAASPNMGYHSSPLVTFVMTLFNVRLGWWSPNPVGNRRWSKEHAGLGLDVMIAEARGSTGDEDRFVYLSDGGHFDNTGIYEMVRRRCRRIVAVDATCDGDFKWTDLIDVVRKIRVDLGIPIELPAAMPGAGRVTTPSRWIEANILYSERDGCATTQNGTLIVLKPLLLPGDSPELHAYAAQSAKDGSTILDPNRFPHQSTADQFYDEQQFESYRLLGFLTAQEALGGKLSPGRQQSVEAGTAQVSTPSIDASRAGAVVTQGVQQMGAGAALAAAFAIGGTLGAAGTVALQPAQVKLSAEDRALLMERAGLQVDATGKLSDEDRKALLDRVRTRADQDGGTR